MTVLRPNFRGRPAKRYVTEEERKKINSIGKRLDTTLRRCQPKMPRAARMLAVGFTKAAMVRFRQGYNEIYPGNEKMSQWGDCTDRTVRRHITAFENSGFIVSLDEKKGGNATSNRYAVRLEVIVEIAIRTGANPHPNLVADIRSYKADI